MVVAMAVLTVGIGALLTVLTSSALSLQRSDQKGTALVLAEKQIELYRTVGYRDIRLDDASVSGIASTDPYMTDSTTPSGSGERTDADTDTTSCDSMPAECLPIQTVTGPDHRRYRIDTYIHTDNPNGGDEVATVTVVVRNANVTPSLPILARSATTFSSVNIANVNGKSIVRLAFSAPTADLTGTPVDSSAISATLTGTSTDPPGFVAGGYVNFFVLPAPATPSNPCTGGSWQSLGSTAVAGDGTYHPPSGYQPPAAGTYYWYASYTGDSQDKKAASICGASMARMVVRASLWSPTLGLTSSLSTSPRNTLISGSTLAGTLTGSSGTTAPGQITYMVYGPNAVAPTTCTTSVGGLWAQVGTIGPNGDGFYAPAGGFTPTTNGTYWYYARYAGNTTNNPAPSACGASMAKTVVTDPPDTFGLSTVSDTQAGTAITGITITANVWSGGVDTSYTGVKTLTFSGPSTSPSGKVPTYPATVTFTNGIATNVSFTPFAAETAKLTVTQGQIVSQPSNSFTVTGRATAGFTIDNVGGQTAGTPITGVTVRTVDPYGNPAPSTFALPQTITWSNPQSSPNGNAPSYPATSTSLTFANAGGQGFAIATGMTLFNASGNTTLKATDGALTGTSASFNVSAATATAIAFINCTQPSSANTTCAGSPLQTGNNSTLQANVAVKDIYGNIAVATASMSIDVTSASTANYTVTPSSVSISSGGSQSNQLTVKPVTNNPVTTMITAHVSSGGWPDATIQVKK